MERFSLISQSELYSDPDGIFCWYSDYERLLEANKRLVRVYDSVVGTPCEQIRHAQEVEDLNEKLAWANEGLALLMALMGGRGIVAPDSAEREVYEEWRRRGHVSEHCNNTGTPETPVSAEYNESDTLP